MRPRGDPVRIYGAQRAGIQRRLVEALGMTEERAEALIVAWEREAEQRGVPKLANGYWAVAEEWIADQRR
jgi:hypothetical protein